MRDVGVADFDLSVDGEDGSETETGTAGWGKGPGICGKKLWGNGGKDMNGPPYPYSIRAEEPSRSKGGRGPCSF